MKNAGYIQVTEGVPRQGGKVLREYDTFTCAHCNCLVVVKTKRIAGVHSVMNWCRHCMKMVCPQCGAAGGCDPFEEKLRRVEARYLALRSYGLL